MLLFLEERGEEALGVGNVVGNVGVEDVSRGLDAAPGAGPLLEGRVLGPDVEVEEEVVWLGTCLLNDGEGFGLVKAGEVEEV